MTHLPLKDPRLRKGWRQAEAITRHNAKTFHFASRFLAPEKRYAAYAIYAMCRLTDDAVDENVNLLIVHELNEMRGRIAAAYDNAPIDDALQAVFKETVRRYDIPRTYFDELLAGIEMDLTKKRYEDFGELYLYCYRVAGVVGLMMLKIFGAQDARAQQHAIDLGVAFQLTNILRDIREDYERGRIYLPREDLERFGVTEDRIAAGLVDREFIALLKFEIERARRFYAQAAEGLKLIKDPSSRLVAGAMKDLYGRILRKIEKNGYDVFRHRARTHLMEKTAAVALLALKRPYR